MLNVLGILAIISSITDTKVPNARCPRTVDGIMPMEYLNTEILDPSMGHVFLAETDAFQFYNLYALRKGFGIRIHKQVKNVAGAITTIDYVCSCEVCHSYCFIVRPLNYFFHIFHRCRSYILFFH